MVDRGRDGCARPAVPVRPASPSTAERTAHGSGGRHSARAPRFLHASRGAVTVCSADLFVRWGKLFGCEHGPKSARSRCPVPLASWALDRQGMLADAVFRLYDFGESPSRRPCISAAGRRPAQPILHVVTLNGLRRVSRAFAPRETQAKQGQARETKACDRQIDLSIAQWSVWPPVCSSSCHGLRCGQ